MQSVLRQWKDAYRHPVPLVLFAIGTLLALQVFDLFLPLLRFGVLLLILAAFLGLIYAGVRLVVMARSSDPECTKAKSLSWVAAGIGCGGMAIVGSIVLGLLSTTPAASPAPESERALIAPKSQEAGLLRESAAHSHLTPVPTKHVRNARPLRNIASPQAVRAEQLTEEFLKALLDGAMRQRQPPPHRASPGYPPELKWLIQCRRCGGAGVYRYVDGQGSLQVRQCPSCYGTGKAG